MTFAVGILHEPGVIVGHVPIEKLELHRPWRMEEEYRCVVGGNNALWGVTMHCEG